MAGTTPGEAPVLRLAAALDGWNEWGLALSGRPKLIGVIPGGRTNWNFHLTAPGMDSDLVLRLNHSAPGRLGIDRALERHILSCTAKAGISRPFCHWDPADRFVVFPFLEARTWTSADFASLAQRARLWPLIQRLGEIRIDRPRRNYSAYLHHYWQQLALAGRIEPELEQAWALFQPRLEAFDQSPWPARLVHHDLIPANILDTGDRLLLIDWEYAAPGHPDIDIWSVDPGAITEPFVAEIMGWINTLWERIV